MKHYLVFLPNRLQQWQLLTLCLMVVGYSGYYLCRSNLSVVMPDMIAEFTREGADPASVKIQLGFIASIGTIAYALGKFLSGTLFDFLGGKQGFLGGMAGTILFTLLCCLGGGIPFFTLAWMGSRFSQSMGWVGMVKLASRWFPPTSYGTAMGILSFSYLFGDAIARKFMSILLSYGMGWRGIFLVGASILSFLWILNRLFLKETPIEIGEPEPAATQDTLFGNEGNNAKPKSLKLLLGPLLKNKVFWIACFLSLTCTFVRESFNTWTPTYFHEALGLNSVQAASQSAWFPFLGGLSVLISGCLSDYLGPKGRAKIIFWGLTLSGIAQLFLAHTGGFSAFWPIFFVGLTGFLLIGPYSFLAGALALDFGGKQGSATACGFIDGIGYMGGYLSGITVAKISLYYGWQGVFEILAIVSLGAGLISLFLLRRTQPPAEFLLEKT